MGTVLALNPVDKKTYSFSGNSLPFAQAIANYGYVPVHADGTPFITQIFQGGYVIDGAPTNVYIEGFWWTGQKELLQPEWAAGRIPTPTIEIQNAPTAPMPADVAAEWARYQAGGSTGIFSSIPTPVLIGAAVLVAWKFLK